MSPIPLKTYKIEDDVVPQLLRPIQINVTSCNLQIAFLTKHGTEIRIYTRAVLGRERLTTKKNAVFRSTRINVDVAFEQKETESTRIQSF